MQLGGGLLCAVLLPFAVAGVLDGGLFENPVFVQSAAAALVSVLGGYYTLRSLTKFPGIQGGYYVLPVFLSAFAISFTVLFLLRLGYSRPLLIASIVLCLGWYYVVYFKMQRAQRIRIGVVPFGNVRPLWEIGSVTFELLDEPAVPDGCSAIAADFRADMPDAWVAFLADTALNGVTVIHVKQLRQALTGQVEIEHLSENSHGSLVPQMAYMSFKTGVDRISAAAALLLLWPGLLVLYMLVRSTSPGPAIFRQRRVGYRGEVFNVWKFRTMTHRPPSAPQDEREHAITLANDSRITPLGRVLRRTRLDELPQLVNVLRGQMSFIGPRPEAEVLSRWYQQEIPFYRYRHIVRPGITGWAQVNQGHVAEVSDVHRKLNYDFYYISNFSLWLDVLIVIRTIRTMVTGYGSR